MPTRPYTAPVAFSSTVFARLGVERAAQYLVPPDGYIAFSLRGKSLLGLERYLVAARCGQSSQTRLLHPSWRMYKVT